MTTALRHPRQLRHLTNMSEEDFRRVISLHLSPFYVSVHATDPAARVRLLRNKRAGQILPLMRRLADAGIEMHCQIVLCPGYNDGAVLDRTLTDLAEFWPDVLSVAVVPLGTTRFREKLTALQPLTAEHRATVAQLEDGERLHERLAALRLRRRAVSEGGDRGAARNHEEFPQSKTASGIASSRRPAPSTYAPARRPTASACCWSPARWATAVAALTAELTRLTGHTVEALGVQPLLRREHHRGQPAHRARHHRRRGGPGPQTRSLCRMCS